METIRDMTLVMSAYNNADCIEQSLETLANQNDTRFSLVLVDNNSTDCTLELLHCFRKDAPFPVDVLVEKRPGQIHGNNTGARFAIKKGAKTVAFADCDGQFASDWSVGVKESISSHPEAEYGYSAEYFRGDRLEDVPKFAHCLTTVEHWRHWMRDLVGGPIIDNNCYVRAEAFLHSDGYDAEWVESQDTLLTLKLLALGCQGAYYPHPIFVSPRRLLDNGNMRKWCQDKSYREIVEVDGEKRWKTIDINSPEYQDRELVDLNDSEMAACMITRSERIFRRLLVLVAFELHPNKPISTRLEHFVQGSNCQIRVSHYLQRVPQARAAVFAAHQRTLARYKAIDRLVRNDKGLIELGGMLIRDRLPSAYYHPPTTEGNLV